MTWLRAHWSELVSGLALAAVAGVAGVISYSHIYRLTLALHQPVLVARLMPIAVDGLVVVGSVVLLQSGGLLGWLGLGPGVVISVFANVESGIGYGLLAAVWAGIPAVAFALASFMLERWLKARVSSSDVMPAVPVPAEESAVDAVAPAALNGHGTGTTWAQPVRTGGWL